MNIKRPSVFIPQLINRFGNTPDDDWRAKKPGEQHFKWLARLQKEISERFLTSQQIVEALGGIEELSEPEKTALVEIKEGKEAPMEEFPIDIRFADLFSKMQTLEEERTDSDSQT